MFAVIIPCLCLTIISCTFSYKLDFLRARTSQWQLFGAVEAESPKRYCLNVNLYIKPEKREEFIAVIKQNQAGTLANEPLAKLYTWGESTTSPNTFHFQEQYTNITGFEAHTKSKHFSIWEQFASTLDSPFSRPPEIFFFEEI